MADSSLQSTGQEIGGVYVTIGADVAPFRAGVATTKTEAGQLESLKPKVVIGLAGGEKLRADAQRAVAAASVGLKIAVPVVAEASGLRSQLAALPAMVKPIIVPVQFQLPGGGGLGGPLALPSPSGAGGGMLPPIFIGAASASPGGPFGGGGAKFVPSRVIATQTPPPMLAAPGGGGGGYIGPPATPQPAAGPAPGVGGGSPLGQQPLRGVGGQFRKIYTLVKVAAAIDAGLTVGSAAVDTARGFGKIALGEIGSIGSHSFEKPEESELSGIREGIRQNIRSLPFGVGNVIDRAGNFIGKPLNIGARILTDFQAGRKFRGFQTDEGAAEDTLAEAKKQDEQTAKTAARVVAGRTFNEEAVSVGGESRQFLSLRGQTPEQQQLSVAKQDQRVFEETTAKQSHQFYGKDTDEIVTARKAIADKVAALDKQAQQSLITEYKAGLRDQNAVIVSAGAERLRASGHTIDAEKMELKAGLDAEVEAARDAVDQLKAQGASPTQVGMAQGRVTALEQAREVRIQAQQTAIDREGQQTIEGAARGSRISGLRITGKNQEAEEQEIRDSFKPRLDEAKDKYGANSPQYKSISDEETKRLQELAVERAKDADKRIVAAKTEAAVAGLRITNQYLEAELKAYDDQTEAIKKDLKDRQAAQPEVDATLDARKAGRAEITTRQSDERKEIGTNLQTRQQIATAEGKGQDQLAGVIGRIADLDKEARAAKGTENEGEVRKTQIAELKAQEDRLKQPTGYATETDLRRIAPGGPTGQAGDELSEEMKRIRQARRERGEDVPEDDTTSQANRTARRPSGRGRIVSPSRGASIGPAGETSDARAKREVAESHGRRATTGGHFFDRQNARSDRQRAATRDVNAKRATSEADRIAALPEVTDPTTRAVRRKLVAGLRERAGKLASPQTDRELDTRFSSPNNGTDKATELLKSIDERLKQLVDKRTTSGLPG